jgi:hypothetical protein
MPRASRENPAPRPFARPFAAETEDDAADRGAAFFLGDAAVLFRAAPFLPLVWARLVRALVFVTTWTT